MQESLTFPTVSSPHHRFTFSQSYFTDYSERCSPESTPFVSAPSSPGRHCNGGFYFSAPTSPHWGHTFSAENEGMAYEYPPSIPLHWDEKPGTPRRRSNGKDDACSFLTTSDFEFSARFVELEDPSMSPAPMSSANELFCNGQIKPLRITSTHPSSSVSCTDDQGHMLDCIDINEHATNSICTSKHTGGLLSSAFEFNSRNGFAGSSNSLLSTAFEFNNRNGFAGSSNSSISAPHSPRFSSTFGCSNAPRSADTELNRGKPASFISAPQSPRSPLTRVKGAFCGVSPSKLDRVFDISVHMPIRAHQHKAEGSSTVGKSLGTSMQWSMEGSNHPMESLQQVREGFQRSGRSMLSLALRSHGASHRRTRSFSPLRIFQRTEPTPSNSPSSSSITAPSMEAIKQDISHGLSQVSFASKKECDEDSSTVQRSSNKRWTLKDLLHRKSGGENRSNSSRTSSRRSAASVDSPSSVEKMSVKSLSAGRSSSASSHSSASAKLGTKDVVTSRSTSSGRAKTLVPESMDQLNCINSNKKGLRNIMCDIKTQNLCDRTHSEGKAKSSNQKGMKAHVQKDNKGASIAINQSQGSMQKAQPERSSMCEVNNSSPSKNSKAKDNSQRGIQQKGNKGCISPHEMHYVMHKAQTEELRKRTFLPYRQGLLGCLGFTSRSYRTVSTISKTLQSVSG